MKVQRLLFCQSVLLATVLAGCAKHSDSPPLVAQLKQTKQIVNNALQTESLLGLTQIKAVVTEVTLRKDSLFNRSFLYSSSLQFSSIVDGEISTAMMGLSLGQVPANFEILDSKLRLVTDSSINFESDVNHPSRLVHEFPVLRQDEETITIRADKASPIMDTFLFGNDNKVATRASWIRSLEYVEADELFLIESSVELIDGSVGSFMESLRPREKQVPADIKPIFADAELNDQAERYRFLDAGEVYVNKAERERIKTKVAQRFVLRNGEPIKWYITPNVPDAYINDVKNSVEGWNRYSRAAGMPDIVRFEGRLPEGVKVGDPRYNLIIWDTVQDAGAAYESQNSDPVSGVQSHSMIYIPYAWINIGKEYWKKAGATEGKSAERAAALSKLLQNRSFLGRKLPVNCMDDLDMHLAIEARQTPEMFARGLLKGVIFHEMGHALGLAHNFKGSLSFDPNNKEKHFTTSIMDYNHYNEEESSFANVDSADGPLLEYDRQIISVLYNEGKDVKASDAVVPACNDTEADSTDDGIDPLCNRYDIGADITKQALLALEMLSNPEARSGRMQALPLALAGSVEGLPVAAEVKTIAAAEAALQQIMTDVQNITSIYTASSANSLGYLGTQAMKSLKIFREGVLLEGYDEIEMRERSLTLLETVAALNQLPPTAKQALEQVKASLLTYLGGTAAVTEMSQADQEAAMAKFAAATDKSWATLEVSLLSRMRTRLITALANAPTAPLAFHSRNGTSLDLEVVVMGLLEQMSAPKAGPGDRPMAERTAAITSLKTYAQAESYKEIAARVRAGLALEIRSSTDAKKRQALRKLLDLIS